MKHSRPVAGVTAAFAFLSACHPGAPAFQPPPPAPVTVASPLRQNVADVLEATGTTRGLETVQLRPRVQGFVQERLVEGGRRVDQGQLLFRIDARPFELMQQQRTAEVGAATAQLQLSEAVLARTKAAVEQDAAAKVELDRAQAELAANKAKLELAQAMLKNAELDVGFSKITAPRPGRLSVDVARPGQLVDQGTVLGTLVDDAKIFATWHLAERDYARLQQLTKDTFADGEGDAGIDVQMAVGDETGYPHHGHLDRRDNRVDADTGTITLEAVFDNQDGALLAGMFARVRIELRQRQLWTVPVTAVGHDPQGAFVLVVDADDMVQRHGIELGGSSGDRRGVTKGLDGTEKVVINGLQRARPGTKVAPQAAKPAPDAAPAAPGKAEGR